MEKFIKLEGVVAPMDRPNVDTDAIIPKQYLKSVKRTGFGPNLFDGWRYTDPGEPGQDHTKRQLNTNFVLNQPRYQDASVLLGRENFGCGSSREHAVWALEDAGFRVVIAPSFADIFFNNCFKNGVLPIVLAPGELDQLFNDVDQVDGYMLTIDLEKQLITTPAGRSLNFDVDKFRKYCLINGLDDIGLTLKHADEIRAFETTYRKANPWLSV